MRLAFARLHLRHARYVFVVSAFILMLARLSDFLTLQPSFRWDAILDYAMIVYCGLCAYGMRKGKVNEHNVDAATFVLGVGFLVSTFGAVWNGNSVENLMSICILLITFGLLVMNPLAFAGLFLISVAGNVSMLILMPDPKGLVSYLQFATIASAVAAMLCFAERRVSYGHVLRLQAENEQRANALEAQRDRAEKAARNAVEANQAKEVFLANMSHELRTPLTGILGLTDVLGGTQLTSAQSHYLDMVRSNGRMLLNILNDILDLSKLEAGKLALAPEVFDPAAATRDVAELLRVSAEQKGLRLHCQTARNLPSHVRSDPLRVRQILFNLIGNAVKYTDRGAITIELMAIEGKAGSHLVWRIQDTGVGIAPNRLDGLFRRFDSMRGGDATRVDSTGLGLSICRHLTDLLGGEISIESEVNQGSCFTVDIPVEVAAAPAAAEAPRETGAQLLAGLSLLVAEDNAVNQLLIRRLLEQAGAEVTVAPNGEAAVSAVRGASFDLVLMDIQMPLMDGVAATREIRRQAAHVDLPIVALTANAFDSDRESYLAAGMNGFVAKPIDVPTLIAEIRRLTRDQAVTAQAISS